MANKRMFSKDITTSDAFLDMPASTQALYFHLGMEADDDGFIGNPKKVMRVIGVGEDDIKILFTKRFLLQFPSGVVVVKHHRINNNWDKYNCKRTMYLEEFSQLNIKDNKAYTLDKSQGIPLQSENSLKTVFRIEENRIDKNSSAANAPLYEITKEEPENPRAARKLTYPHAREAFKWFPEVDPSWGINTTELKAGEILFEKGESKVRKNIKYCENHLDDDSFPIHRLTPYLLATNWLRIAQYAKN